MNLKNANIKKSKNSFNQSFEDNLTPTNKAGNKQRKYSNDQ